MPFISQQSLEKLRFLDERNDKTIDSYHERCNRLELNLTVETNKVKDLNNQLIIAQVQHNQVEARLQKIILLAGLHGLEIVDVPEKVIPEKRIPASIVMRKYNK